MVAPQRAQFQHFPARATAPGVGGRYSAAITTAAARVASASVM